VLDRNVASLHHLLDDVMDLARLQAGKETLRVAQLDVASLLVEMVDGLHVHAEQRELFLRHDGPAPFLVEGDAVKLRRLVQNLVLNAIKYTERGGVTVSWGDSVSNDVKRWVVSVQDTGPGFAAGPGSPLVGALEEATEAAEQATGAAGDVGEVANSNPSPVADGPSIVRQEQGEGIGLSIVKRLAELLDATVEVQSDSTGTTFRVVLPRHYAA
jgi:signal transduction histidine kinase